jgi:hypothetical protein
MRLFPVAAFPEQNKQKTNQSQNLQMLPDG